MQWTFVSDAAEACVRPTEVPEAAGEAFNIGHVEPTTQCSWVEALARVAGAESLDAALREGAVVLLRPVHRKSKPPSGERKAR